MSFAERAAKRITSHTRIVIAVMVVLTLLVGAGAPKVEETSSLDQFQTDSLAGQKLDYIQANFSTGGNTTSAQVIVRGEDVLSKESLLSLVAFEERLRANTTVNETLVTGEDPVVGIHDAVATAAIRQEQARELRRFAAELEADREALQADRRALENRTATLNATRADLRDALTRLRANESAPIEPAFDAVRANTTVELNATQLDIFTQATTQLRAAETQSEIEAAYRLGTVGVLRSEYADVRQRGEALAARGEALRERAANLTARQKELRTAPRPTLAEKRAQLEEMNASAVEETIGLVLDGSNSDVLAFMPTDYETGATDANATVMLVSQSVANPSTVSGSASDRIVTSQLAIQDLAQGSEGLEFLVFGNGIVSHELSASQTDSMLIVGPLALLFVLIALAVGYRDVLDIVLGLAGIGAVLTWTFGFMGWVGIDFSQIFIAVPVLLIGLSIDYAIHIFMRHREERDDMEAGPRPSMAVALSGVGIALVWVTATTVIGFLSNLTSPVPPIREFGIVSAVGIASALLIFGLLIPSLKIELDELLEGYGFDRQKRAIGTGGGRFSQALSVGATAARKAPYAVIILVLLVSAVAAVGGSQVSTQFSQQDFLAEEPPDWMETLPEPFAPGEYTVKQNLELINDRFVREDSQAQVLLEGDVGTAKGLDRLDAARERASEQSVTQKLSTGEAAIQDPLSVMQSVAATNSTFNATFQAADTDDDGVPDQNVTAVYDTLFAVAPDQAGRYIYRVDGEVQALRMVVSISGGADGGTITDQMQAVAGSIEGEGITATATGSSVLNNIVQEDLLDTVVESLVITLVVVFLFLMATYRISDGSATLGAVTLLPVAFAVAWIVGSMFVLDIPFNAITGLITSLTIGLGVAYTIHLSERYTQELERHDSVWEAMDTAVTGTGGALMGSAATTVGGFGVLVFAILPPLQQFGLIAGLSIIYSFLGSVFILPSLLVVWTRYVGPDWAGEEIAATNRDDGAEAGDDTALAGSLANGAGDVAAVRRVAYEQVRPGQWVEVTVTLDGFEGRFALRETADSDVLDFVSAEPTPVEVVTSGQRLYVAWRTGDRATATYRVRVPDDLSDGQTVPLDGIVMTAGEDTPVEGDRHLEVVTDLFERAVVRGSASDDDLAAAEELLATGELSEKQFERVYRAWLRDGDDADGLSVDDPDRQGSDSEQTEGE